MAITIITDSTSYIPQDLLDKYDIRVIPQVLIWGEEILKDGVDITTKEFYTRLSTATVMPQTSQVTIATFSKVFEEIKRSGNEVLCVLVSQKLSGTINSFEQSAKLFPDMSLTLIDSNSVAMGLGFQVLYAARAAQAGKSAAEIKALVEGSRDNTGVVLTPLTLEFLHRGGRIGGGSRFLGSALNIKPILEVADGRVEAVERVRTRKKAIKRIIQITKERIGGRTPVLLAALHANALEDAQELMNLALQEIPAQETMMSEVSPVVGTHAGPGTIGLAFMAGIDTNNFA